MPVIFNVPKKGTVSVTDQTIENGDSKTRSSETLLAHVCNLTIAISLGSDKVLEEE